MLKTYGILHAYATGVALTGLVTFFTNNNTANNHHNLSFYAVSAVVYTWVMVANGRASKLRYPMTLAAAFYLLHRCGAVWILPLFEGSPKLAPIYRPITHFVAPPFPILLIVPAFGMDLLLRIYKEGRGWKIETLRSLALGFCFTSLLLKLLK